MGMDKTTNSTLEPSKSTLDFQPDYIPELIDLFLTSVIQFKPMLMLAKYISPESLLDSLLDQLDKNQDELWQLRVCNTILLWADDHWEDFNDKMIYTLKFLSDKVESDYVAEKLYNQSQIKKKSSFSNWGYLSNTLYEESKSVPKQIAYKKFNWLGDCAVNLIADQLTAIEWDLFSNINVWNVFNSS
ncbi:hypothetical protein HDV02_004585 [Globomyces sp. JEL0801]|nr:hypothetical protein HDV02_004585 [Globomyces sp. JEL0801]